MTESNKLTQEERDLYSKKLDDLFQKHKKDKEQLEKKFDRLWKNMKPLIVDKLKVETDLAEVYRSQIREHLINPEEFDSEKDPTVIIKKEDGTWHFVLPEVNKKTIIEAAINFRDQIEEHLEPNIEPAEELNTVSHLLTLLYELEILEVINQRFKPERKKTPINKARLIGTLIGKTDKDSIENIRKYLGAIEVKASKNNPINGNSIKAVTKILTEYGLKVENL